MSDSTHYSAGGGIAVIGMAGRFPGADDVATFWRNLAEGVNSIVPLKGRPAARSRLPENPRYVAKTATVQDADLFDAHFFGIYPKQAQELDPQHRLFLECCWHALEDAGYIPDETETSVGVFAGCHMNTYILARLAEDPKLRADLADSFPGGNLIAEISNDKDYLATRVSYLLNLRGPSIAVQTACSTSLVAVAQACTSLEAGECHMALAGGVTITFPQNQGYLFTEDSILSPEGVCRTFDANAQGTVFADGVSVVALKRAQDALADGDDVYAVIKGWGVNNDGRDKQGYTAPSPAGQTDAILRAHQKAKITADTITYVEAHGTGTQVGDPIEIAALTEAFRKTTDKKQFCRIGSLKSNMGHLDVAAGCAGLIKTCLALRHRQIPPSLNFESPNPRIDFENSPFVVNTELADWPAGSTPRRAGLSAFGVGGTNAHVVVEETAEQDRSHNGLEAPQLLTLSARTESALDTMTTNLINHLRAEQEQSCGDVAYTLAIGRKRFKHTRIVVAHDINDAADALAAPKADRVFTHQGTVRDAPVVFLFPGQGSQHPEMAGDLYRTDTEFARNVDQCAEMLEPLLDRDLRELMFAGRDERLAAELNQTHFAQPAMFVVSYAMARWWQSRGVEPSAMIGHSVGEFAAACLAGVFSLEDALRLVARRGQLMQALPAGQMLAVRLSEGELQPLLSGNLSIAAVNSPALCVVSGPTEEVAAFASDLEAGNLGEPITCRLLRTSHAFHSAMMDPAVDQFADVVMAVEFNPPRLPIISSVTARQMTAEEVTDPDYWCRQIRETVRFADAVANLLDDPSQVLLEVGPGQALTTLARQHTGRAASQPVLSSLPHAQQEGSARVHALTTLGRLWQAGAEVDWQAVFPRGRYQRVHLPTYPFERQRYWYDTGSGVPQPALLGEGFFSDGADGLATEHAAADLPTDDLVQRVVRGQLQLMHEQLEVWKNAARNQ